MTEDSIVRTIPFLGKETLADFYDCKGDLDDAKSLEKAVRKAVKAAGMKTVNIHSTNFKPQGLTVLACLSSSALAVHTFPEHGHMLVDVLTCVEDSYPEKAVDALQQIYRPEHVERQNIRRGENKKIQILPLDRALDMQERL